MTYTRLARTDNARSDITLTAAEVAKIDAELFEQDARITALVTALAALDARVVILETP